MPPPEINPERMTVKLGFVTWMFSTAPVKRQAAGKLEGIRAVEVGGRAELIAQGWRGAASGRRQGSARLEPAVVERELRRAEGQVVGDRSIGAGAERGLPA